MSDKFLGDSRSRSDSDSENIENAQLKAKNNQKVAKLDLQATMNLGSDDGENDSSEGEEDVSVSEAKLVNGKNSSLKRGHFDAFDNNSEESDSEEEEDDERDSAKIKDRTAKKINRLDQREESDDDDIISDNDNTIATTQTQTPSSSNNDKDELDSGLLKQLTQQSSLFKDKNPGSISQSKLAKIEKKLKKTGVIYISKVPPYMKPAKMRQILLRFGKVDRLFLKPETHQQFQKRVKRGGNKKRMYVEGWAEFMDKRDAKLCVATLNGQKIGGKKGSFYYDDMMNMKYLKGFKWIDLTSQMAKENEVKQSKLMMEISNANKLNKTFIRNVEKSKMIGNIQKKRKQRAEEAETEDKNKE